jgi:hypothetical protein
MMAVLQENMDVITYLIDHGADPTIRYQLVRNQFNILPQNQNRKHCFNVRIIIIRQSPSYRDPSSKWLQHKRH